MDTPLEQFDERIRHAVPMVLTASTILLCIVQWPIPSLAALVPNFTLMCIFFWSAHKPESMPNWLLFTLGILFDAMLDLPLGLSSLTFLLVAQTVKRQHAIFSDGSFLTLWAAFSLISTFVQLAQWLILCLMGAHFLPVEPLLLQIVMSIALFPAIGGAQVLLQRLISS